MVTFETYNKFVTVSENLRSNSEHIFEEMRKMDLEEEKALTKSRTVCLEIVTRLDEEREILMNTFYVDFVRKFGTLPGIAKNEEFGEEVYAMPWYYLNPKYRKTVLTCLTLVQRPLELRALMIWSLFRDILKDIISKLPFADFLDVTVHTMTQLAKAFFETDFSIFYSISTLVMTIAGFIFANYLFLKNGTEISYTAFRGAGSLLAVFLVLYECCIIGYLFKEMNEGFGEEVYAMPWYYLNPKYRKTVLTCLTLVQRPLELRALKIIPLTKDSITAVFEFGLFLCSNYGHSSGYTQRHHF
ncbi:hypothetical protein U1Q18_049318 [Sarracenia purpurea var. burkii]